MNQNSLPVRDQEPEQQYRANAYRLLAALLRNVPDTATLDYTRQLAGLTDGGDTLATSMIGLGLAARHADPLAIDDEFHALFIGLGKGEVVPYASWYLTGFLMEKPLGQLRQELAQLGFERDPDVHEPEDHAAALCEVMALLIEEQAALTRQTGFFQRHMANWLEAFFRDLQAAPSAAFYQAVAQLGMAFIRFEQQYFDMQSQESEHENP
ncbi:MAG: molecular chaperone TorD family protein [Gammaproteobacteria bacterium]|nr:molecular chaperone TorD family protein [Gammaproteobacteria bacterium]MBU1724700.1 molecular chaperone TorD family protein [Gammaproteobacteria bacterium]MBU2005022.1 molecular chaperone TorD family protein [Gammaproteobacteria bacterium]